MLTHWVVVLVFLNLMKFPQEDNLYLSIWCQPRQADWAKILTPSLVSYVIVGRLPNLSVIVFSSKTEHDKNSIIIT